MVGLPERALVGQESYSLLSHVDAENVHVDTFHFLFANISELVNIAQRSATLNDFVEKLNHMSRGRDLLFQENVRKMIRYINGVL